MQFGRLKLDRVTKDNHVVLMSQKPYTLPHKCKRDFLTGVEFLLKEDTTTKVSVLDRHILIEKGIKYAVIYWHRHMIPFCVDITEPFEDDQNGWKQVSWRGFNAE
jgi:hypothetical protein